MVHVIATIELHPGTSDKFLAEFRKLVPDRLIPPTLIAGLTPPAMTESIIFLILLGVMVDPTLLFGGAIATGLGGVMGAPLVARARV